jgi:DNA-binding NtrC family response regulator
VTKKILVVDDDPEIRGMLRTFLESERYEVEEAGSCRAAEDALRSYRWPGNIRELQNVLERALLRTESREIGARHLGLEAGAAVVASWGPAEMTLTLEEVERRHIARVLADEGGHVERAARRLGVPRSTLYLRIKGLGLAPGQPPPARTD